LESKRIVQKQLINDGCIVISYSDSLEIETEAVGGFKTDIIAKYV